MINSLYYWTPNVMQKQYVQRGHNATLKKIYHLEICKFGTRINLTFI